MVVCLDQGADLHMAQLMPLPLTVSCFSKIQIGFTFLVPAHLGSPGKRAVKRVCVFHLIVAVNGFLLYTPDKCILLVNLLKQEVNTGPFMDFEVKKNMRIAPSCRVPDIDAEKMAQHLDQHIANQVTCCSYLASHMYVPDFIFTKSIINTRIFKVSRLPKSSQSLFIK